MKKTMIGAPEIPEPEDKGSTFVSGTAAACMIVENAYDRPKETTYRFGGNFSAEGRNPESTLRCEISPMGLWGDTYIIPQGHAVTVIEGDTMKMDIKADEPVDIVRVYRALRSPCPFLLYSGSLIDGSLITKSHLIVMKDIGLGSTDLGVYLQ